MWVACVSCDRCFCILCDGFIGMPHSFSSAFPLSTVQYGQKSLLCSFFAPLSPSASDDELIETLNTAIYVGYGPDFTSMCFYDSDCLRHEDAPLTGEGEEEMGGVGIGFTLKAVTVLREGSQQV